MENSIFRVLLRDYWQRQRLSVEAHDRFRQSLGHLVESDSNFKIAKSKSRFNTAWGVRNFLESVKQLHRFGWGYAATACLTFLIATKPWLAPGRKSDSHLDLVAIRQALHYPADFDLSESGTSLQHEIQELLDPSLFAESFEPSIPADLVASFQPRAGRLASWHGLPAVMVKLTPIAVDSSTDQDYLLHIVDLGSAESSVLRLFQPHDATPYYKIGDGREASSKTWQEGKRGFVLVALRPEQES